MQHQMAEAEALTLLQQARGVLTLEDAPAEYLAMTATAAALAARHTVTDFTGAADTALKEASDLYNEVRRL